MQLRTLGYRARGRRDNPALRAYTVNVNDKAICFVDTPGHEAFTSMRQGAGN